MLQDKTNRNVPKSKTILWLIIPNQEVSYDLKSYWLPSNVLTTLL